MGRIPAFDPFSHIKFPRIFFSNFDGYVLSQILKKFETNFLLIFASLCSYSVYIELHNFFENEFSYEKVNTFC